MPAATRSRRHALLARRAPLRALVMKGRIHRSPRSSKETVTDTNVHPFTRRRHLCRLVLRRARTSRPSGPLNVGRRGDARMTRALNRTALSLKNFFATVVSAIPMRRFDPMRTRQVSTTQARSRREAGLLRCRYALCSVSVHSAPTPRTPPLASQHLLDRTERSEPFRGLRPRLRRSFLKKGALPCVAGSRISRDVCRHLSAPASRCLSCRPCCRRSSQGRRRHHRHRRPIAPRHPPRKRHRRRGLRFRTASTR